VQGRFQFSGEIKDSSLKSLVVFIIAKRRMEMRGECGWMGSAVPLQLRQRFKPCCPVCAVFGDCANCSGCCPLRVVVVDEEEMRILRLRKSRNSHNVTAWRKPLSRIGTTVDSASRPRSFGDEHNSPLFTGCLFDISRVQCHVAVNYNGGKLL
jgi:hypothetical protein